MQTMQTENLPVFGAPNPALAYTPRPAAYVVVTDRQGRVAAVRGKGRYFLPGGGAWPGETPEQTVAREVREELAREVRLVRRLGAAVQYFFADERHYRMKAVFFAGEFVGDADGAGEHELYWLAPAAQDFYHACHAWAVAQLGGTAEQP